MAGNRQRFRDKIPGLIDRRVMEENLEDSFDPVTKTTTYAPSESGEVLLADATDAGFTITLPDATSDSGLRITIKKIDVTANAVTIATVSSQTIDGASTQSISTQWQSLDIISNGTNWFLI